MDFENFCKTNCMEPSDIDEFKEFLEKRKDNLEKRSIQNWLYVFNIWFDNHK